MLFSSASLFDMPSNRDSTTEDANKGSKPVFNFGLGTSQDGQTGKSTFSFSLNTTTLISPPTVHKQDSAGEHEESDPEENANDDIYFQPQVPLPDKITVVTGEEDEAILYSHRAKLYRYDNKTMEWKERGVGDIKILKHNTTSKIRLLMRREPVLKLCLNHYLTPEIIMRVKDDRSWIWCAKDFSSGEVVEERFAIRFKTPEIAKDFKRMLDETQGLQASSSSPSVERKPTPTSPVNTDDVEIVYERKVSEELRKKAESLMLPSNFYLYLKATPCPGCCGCYTDEDDEKTVQNIRDINITKSTNSSSKTKPSILQKSLLSDVVAISASKTNAKTSQCPTKPKNDFLAQHTSATGKERATAPGDTAVEAPLNRSFFTLDSFSAAIQTPSNIFGGSSSTDTVTNQQASGDNSDAEDATKLQSTSLFGVGDAAQPKITVQPSIFGGPPSSGLLPKPAQNLIFGGGEGGSVNIPSFNQFETKDDKGSGKSVFTIPTTAAPPNEPEKYDTQNPFLRNTSFHPVKPSPSLSSSSSSSSIFNRPSELDSNPILPTNNMLSFSSLASMGATPTFLKNTGDSNVKWEGVGSSVFGNWKPEAKPKDVVNTSIGSDNDVTISEYDPHYDPIVALPELIELKTGEEDEEIMFNERARLYRYDSNIKEWKERGVGQMKVLKHKEVKIYRLLMRRETVHKLVCNQRITADLDLKHMSNTNAALCWFAMNMAEEYDKPKLENLSIRFKNKDITITFKKLIDEIITDIQN